MKNALSVLAFIAALGFGAFLCIRGFEVLGGFICIISVLSNWGFERT